MNSPLTSLRWLEEAIENVKLARVSLIAAHDAPNDSCVRVCIEAAKTHLSEAQAQLRPISERLNAGGKP